MKTQQIFNFLVATALFISTAACSTGADTSAQSQSGHEHQEAADSAPKKALSPRTSAMGNIGNAHVHIDYSSPSARGRVIWGGLVAYDQVWVTGAHQATSIDFSKDVRIGDQRIPAGKYALFTIPGKEEWTVIINKNHEQHLADEYDATLDVARVSVAPQVLESPVEALTFEVSEKGDNAGEVSIKWEKLQVVFPVEVQSE